MQFCTRCAMAARGWKRGASTAFRGCVCVTGPFALTEAGEAAAANLIGPILLVIACRSQSRLVGEINTVLDVEFMRL